MTKKPGISITESGALAGRFVHMLLYGNYIAPDFSIVSCNGTQWERFKDIRKDLRISHINPRKITREEHSIQTRVIEFELIPGRGKASTSCQLIIRMIQRQDDEKWGSWKIIGFAVSLPEEHDGKWFDYRVTAKNSSTNGWCPS